MKVLVPVKRVVDYNVKIRVKSMTTTMLGMGDTPAMGGAEPADEMTDAPAPADGESAPAPADAPKKKKRRRSTRTNWRWRSAKRCSPCPRPRRAGS